MLLTIGMAAFDDYDGVYFTIQALRKYQDLSDCEILVVDNYGDPGLKDFFTKWLPKESFRLIIDKTVQGTAHPRQKVFEEAKGDNVLCMDSHVLLDPNVVHRLKDYFKYNENSPNLLSGPLVYDDLKSLDTHFKDEWGGHMWGRWARDPKINDPQYEQNGFEIPMMGLGIFASCRETWFKVGGFNKDFRGFGGEEGYIHQKFRNAGGLCLCLPWLRWNHRFRRGGEPLKYPNSLVDRFRNYVIGHHEIGLPIDPLIEQFKDALNLDVMGKIVQAVTGSSIINPDIFQAVENAGHKVNVPINKINKQVAKQPTSIEKIAKQIEKEGHVHEWNTNVLKPYIRTEQYNSESHQHVLFLHHQDIETVAKGLKEFTKLLVIVTNQKFTLPNLFESTQNTLDDGSFVYFIKRKQTCNHSKFESKAHIHHNIIDTRSYLTFEADVKCENCKISYKIPKIGLNYKRTGLPKNILAILDASQPPDAENIKNELAITE